MGSILKVKRPNGSIANIPIISGESAYETAVRLGSYDGTEQEFAEGLAAAAEIGDTIALPPAGSATRPVYIDNSHTIQPITHTIQSDVPADAVFTDTVYTLPTASSSTLGGVKTGTSLSSTTGYTACPVDSNGTIYYKNINIPKFNFTFTNTYYDSDNKGFETETNNDLTNFINYINSFFVNNNPNIINNTNTLDDQIYFEFYMTGIPVKTSHNNGRLIFTSGTSTIKFNCIYETDNNDHYITGTFTQVWGYDLVTYSMSFNIYNDSGAESCINITGEIQSLNNLHLSMASDNTTGF